ncbi:MAG: hypothetical protein AAGJ80_12470 [Cyanobacteria bacterium J06553_1]
MEEEKKKSRVRGFGRGVPMEVCGQSDSVRGRGRGMTVGSLEWNRGGERARIRAGGRHGNSYEWTSDLGELWERLG